MMQLETVPIHSISPDPANARSHDARNLEAIKSSLRRFGQMHPIIVDSKGVVRAGNGRLAAAKALGWKQITIVRSDLPLAEMSAFAIADNRTAELAAWDDEMLAAMLADPEIGDVGFSDKEIEALVGAAPTLEEEDAPNDDIETKWLVLVTCRDEPDQLATLKELTEAGRQCKALMG